MNQLLRILVVVVTITMATTEAHAGLSDGFRGLAFGDAAVLESAPIQGCARSSEEGVVWECQTTIGEVSVVVKYAAMEGLFCGVAIEVNGYTNASSLMATFKSAYGPGVQQHDWDDSALAGRFWKDGDVLAGWTYNEFSGDGMMTMFSAPVHDEVERRKKARAAGGVEDL